ncbi:hypothetical protein [Paenibacillus sinopodophylli]|uniref:hypothetical protein n=1 Tax=Paenibacillus sinopodophylli TaxID=1837342 RepID=UPI00110D2282|nr:hypothetical protein [Paenibacillus sinopodophylli]
MSEVIGSQTVPAQQDDQQAAISSAFEVFGLDVPDEQQDALEANQNDVTGQGEPPAKEDTTPAKTIKVKVDKEEREFDISDEKLPEYVQKAYALDKVRGKQTELERNLERAAKLNGFDKTDDYLANLDRMELEAQQRQHNNFKDLRDQLREEAEDAGLDPVKLDAWLDNHPLLQEANKAILSRQNEQEERNRNDVQLQTASKWNDLYTTYPDLAESSKAFGEGGTPDWFTPEMQSRIERGYDPKDAYELAHRNTLTAQTKKQMEQKAIKDQRLGLRAQVETEGRAESEAEVPPELASAFSMFGLDPKAAKKYVKK